MSGTKKTIRDIRQYSRLLLRELDVVKGNFLDTGHTYSQCHLMFELSQHESMNLIQLADTLLLDKSNTSRMVKRLVDLGLVQSNTSPTDQRQRDLSLTARGDKLIEKINVFAEAQVSDAIQTLSPEEQDQVVQGLALYSKALRRRRQQAPYSIRPIQRKDNPAVAQIIEQVMTEYDAIGPGYSINDPELNDMYSAYRDKQSCYLVIERDQQVVGAGGIAPLKGGKAHTCELQKMFFLPETRGLGLGKQLLERLMKEATRRGFTECYLETLDRMERANQLYLRNGFAPLTGSKGKTGHCSCDRWYLRKL